MVEYIAEPEGYLLWCFVETLAKIGECPIVGKGIVLQQSGNAVGVDFRCKHLCQRRGDGFQHRLFAHEMQIGVDGEAGSGQHTLVDAT